ncbi:MAG: trypsin-like peptidase domain-containing protein [Myxococcales bacterium]|nr:trypsin-like peptidase domain-containing protein [Myxococcales bacterium]
MHHRGVVRVYATTQTPDHDNPWQSRTPQASTGSGVVIEGGRILTGAHVVANATFLQVQKISAPDKALAHVIAICHDADLALVAVDDPTFLDDIEGAPLGDLPHLRDKVSVVGYPIGGEEISITEGVVSRIEVQRYSHSQRVLLAATVDAAINPGNSGGPVFRDDKVVGIAFQKLDNADNIGEMVPPPLIRRFLEAVDRGLNPEVPSLGIAVQGLENPTLRRHLGMAPKESGVRVAAVDFGGSAWGVLEVGDVLLAIDGLVIANNHTVCFREGLRTRFDVVLGTRQVGETLTLDVRRGDARLQVEVTLQPHTDLVPRNQYDQAPSYFIYAGLVFQRLTRDYLATWNQWWKQAPKEFLHLYYSGVRTPERQELVVLTHILADAINQGYDHLHDESVVSVNGVQPRDMHDFARLVDAADGDVIIELSRGGLIVLDVAEVQGAHRGILDRYHIGQDRSRDLEPTP